MLVDWILRWLERQAVQSLPLNFVLDLTDTGRLSLAAISDLSSQSQKKIDLRQAAPYGSSVAIDGVDYEIDTDDYRTLLAARQRDPKAHEDGSLTFGLDPAQLDYFRGRENVEQTQAVRPLSVRDRAPEPEVRVDFDPERGATLSAGFRDPDTGDELGSPENSLALTAGWLQFGSQLFRQPDLSEETQELLPEEGETREVPPSKVPEFFARDLALIRSQLSAVLTDEAKRVTVASGDVKNRRIAVEKQAGGWLDFDIEYDLGDLRLTHGEVKHQGVDGEMVRLDKYTWAEVDRESVEEVDKQLENLDARETDDGFRVEIDRFRSLEEFIDSIGGQRSVDAAYQEFLSNLTDFEADPEFRAPEEIERRLTAGGIELRPYQRKGIHWLTWLCRNRLHGLLADDMGLGKTVQSLVALAIAYRELGANRPSLVVAPRSVLGHWREEATRVFGEEISVEVHHGLNRDFEKFAASAPRLIVSTYGTVRSDQARLKEFPLFALILDEATKIKNPNAQRTRAVKSLNASYRLGLSGTPVENHLGELWSIFDFLMRDHLGTRQSFGREFQTPIEEENDPEATERLQRRIDPFIVRRRKDEVAEDLPDKVHMTENVELTDEQKALYGEIQGAASAVRRELEKGDDSAKGTALLNVLDKLKQVCVHPALVDGVEEQPIRGRSNKFDRVIELANDSTANGDQVVIFSQYLKPLDLLGRALSGTGQIRIDGSTDNRQELINESFNTGSARVALCSTRAASHGINLQAANHVIHVDYWWNPATKRQATDRVHRIGQDETVYVHEIWTENTLEDRIRALLKEKSRLTEAVISDVSSLVSQLSADELAAILRTSP